MAILENLLGIDNQTELAKAKEKVSKTRAKELVEKNVIDSFDVGTFKGLAQIHHYLFQDIYPFAGTERNREARTDELRANY